MSIDPTDLEQLRLLSDWGRRRFERESYLRLLRAGLANPDYRPRDEPGPDAMRWAPGDEPSL